MPAGHGVQPADPARWKTVRPGAVRSEKDCKLGVETELQSRQDTGCNLRLVREKLGRE